MRFVTYRAESERAVGLVDLQDQVHDLTSLLGSGDLVDLITRWEQIAPDLMHVATDSGRALEELELLAPIPRPHRNVFCVGRNYAEHAKEFAGSGYDAGANSAPDADHLPSHPVVFTKPASSVIGPDAFVDPHTAVTAELDYEAELAVIIGRGGRDISADRAAEHVWGYTIINDVTARDRQRDHKQWFLGKGLDTFCPSGPYAVTADEIDPAGVARPELQVECRVNGELRQMASTRDLLFGIPTLIETISAGLTLEPGDIIATGTPAGVGVGFKPPRFLQSGDVVEISITGLGTLRNRIA